ncbi:hypothetical protein Naga_100680g1 [Nannochloropsis gaditana]|uniref:Uncharacterized protein n=1 Tax=Nannochloropsis gaditana TaxID=72520 RepID=W7TJZ0_9STRA|nr:hypothetical protein Naga_100680g1 [Nannochloropsis gaditana]
MADVFSNGAISVDGFLFHAVTTQHELLSFFRLALSFISSLSAANRMREALCASTAILFRIYGHAHATPSKCFHMLMPVGSHLRLNTSSTLVAAI